MKIAFTFVRTAVTYALFGVVIIAGSVALKGAGDARESVAEARRLAADVRTVTITVTITGTDAASRATAEKVVRQLNDLQTVDVKSRPVFGPSGGLLQ